MYMRTRVSHFFAANLALWCVVLLLASPALACVSRHNDEPVDADINFQPEGVAVPDGYLADVGQPFGERDRGLSYGWNVDQTGQTRKRSVNADPILDTFCHIRDGHVWEIEVPKGDYEVTVRVGESRGASLNTLDVEGVRFCEHLALDINDREITKVVAVKDGRLTVTGGALHPDTKIIAVKVTATNAAAEAVRKNADKSASVAIPGYAGGLNYKYYEGAWEAVPTPSRQVPYLTGIASRIDLSVADRKVAYALEYEGHLRIDQAGEYTFYVVSDPGCKVWVDGKEVVHNDCSGIRFGFAKPHEASGKITLAQGLHRLHVMFYSDRFTPEPSLEVTYAGSGMERQELAAGVLYHKVYGVASSVAAKPEASPTAKRVLNLTLRTQRLAKDDSGMLCWKTIDAPVQWSADETILIVVDMWNKHWSANGVKAVKEMMPHFNDVVCHARKLGVQIIHSPTEPAMGPYYQHPAYKYMATFPARAVPPPCRILNIRCP